VEGIRAAAERGAGLTRQLLTFSRKQVTQPKRVNVNDLISKLQRMLARLIGENIEVDTRLSERALPVHADPGQFEQVIMNLFVNARDAMPGGGRIRISTQDVSLEGGRYAQITVSDTGCGMDPETLSRIFEPFFTTKPVDKGTGLGLSTVYGIIKDCGGTIQVRSEPLKGAEFTIHLPLLDGAPEASLEVEGPASLGERERGARTILLVEDEERLRKVYAEMLRRKGYGILVAASGQEALAICARADQPVDLLVTDVVMPGMGGFELARRAGEVRPGLRVIFMSGYTNETLETLGAGHERGFIFIQKPFNTAQMIARVREAIG
jgi:CheY-like chemotaxis protein